MRRLTTVVFSSLLLLAACGDDDDDGGAAVTEPAGATTAAPADGLPVVTGEPGSEPTITIPSSDPPAELQVVVLEEGDGPAVEAGDQLTAHYVGKLWRDGSTFDSSWARGEPATFPVGTGNLIAAWDEGLVGKPYGSRILLVVPADKGYGPSGQPAAGILGTDTMVFVVDLIEQAG